MSKTQQHLLRRAFGVAAVLLGGLVGAIALAINWYLGKLLP